ncbi:MAG: hypothetical protein WC787_05185 [Patescibacteria group bacterium]|jgi:hypothetical protein
MKFFLMIVTFVLVTGCGMSVHTSRVENGRTVSDTTTQVGYRAVESKTVESNPIMETCLAEIGNVPPMTDRDGNVVMTAETICQRRVLKEEDLRERQREQRYYYYPNAYANGW